MLLNTCLSTIPLWYRHKRFEYVWYGDICEEEITWPMWLYNVHTEGAYIYVYATHPLLKGRHQSGSWLILDNLKRLEYHRQWPLLYWMASWQKQERVIFDTGDRGAGGTNQGVLTDQKTWRLFPFSFPYTDNDQPCQEMLPMRSEIWEFNAVSVQTTLSNTKYLLANTKLAKSIYWKTAVSSNLHTVVEQHNRGLAKNCFIRHRNQNLSVRGTGVLIFDIINDVHQ